MTIDVEVVRFHRGRLLQITHAHRDGSFGSRHEWRQNSFQGALNLACFGHRPRSFVRSKPSDRVQKIAEAPELLLRSRPHRSAPEKFYDVEEFLVGLYPSLRLPAFRIKAIRRGGQKQERRRHAAFRPIEESARERVVDLRIEQFAIALKLVEHDEVGRRRGQGCTGERFSQASENITGPGVLYGSQNTVSDRKPEFNSQGTCIGVDEAPRDVFHPFARLVDCPWPAGCGAVLEEAVWKVRSKVRVTLIQEATDEGALDGLSAVEPLRAGE